MRKTTLTIQIALLVLTLPAAVIVCRGRTIPMPGTTMTRQEILEAKVTSWIQATRHRETAVSTVHPHHKHTRSANTVHSA